MPIKPTRDQEAEKSHLTQSADSLSSDELPPHVQFALGNVVSQTDQEVIETVISQTSTPSARLLGTVRDGIPGLRKVSRQGHEFVHGLPLILKIILVFLVWKILQRVNQTSAAGTGVKTTTASHTAHRTKRLNVKSLEDEQ